VIDYEKYLAGRYFIFISVFRREARGPRRRRGKAGGGLFDNKNHTRSERKIYFVSLQTVHKIAIKCCRE
jgi:hypothetical protein